MAHTWCILFQTTDFSSVVDYYSKFLVVYDMHNQKAKELKQDFAEIGRGIWFP